MQNWILTLPPGLWAFLVTLLGRWGEHRLAGHSGTRAGASGESVWSRLAGLLGVNLVFFGILPSFLLFVFQPLLPFQGARAGLALGVAVFVLGLLPARILDAPDRGWDHAAWLMLIDFSRAAGALTLAGWILSL